MITPLSVSALLIIVMLMQMGTGALGPLDTLSAIELGFSNIQIGIIGAAHFTGFIIGCFGAPSLVRWVGHVRVYIVTEALSITAVLLHPVFPIFWAWCLFRVFTGLAIATSFTAVESWLNAKLTRQNRGRFFFHLPVNGYDGRADCTVLNCHPHSCRASVLCNIGYYFMYFIASFRPNQICSARTAGISKPRPLVCSAGITAFDTWSFDCRGNRLCCPNDRAPLCV